MDSVHDLTDKLVERHRLHTSLSAFTVAISGIDASGKGYITKLLQEELQRRGFKVANINIDPWQNPIAVRLRKENAAENFYESVFRRDDFFRQLIFPLQNNKSIYLEMEGIQTDADIYYPLVYNYKDIDILLVEGIFLFKRKYLFCYDYKIWVDCTFETGLKRALQRNVEKLDEERLIHDYETYYYPAQRLHFEKDQPKEIVDLIFENNNNFVL